MTGGAVLVRHFFLHISGSQLRHESIAVVAVIAGTCLIAVGNIVVIIGGEGGGTVAHQHHNRRSLIGNAGSIELLPGSPQTALDISTAAEADGGGHILIYAVFQISGVVAPPRPRGADIGIGQLNVIHRIVRSGLGVLTLDNRGVPIQGKQDRSTIGIQHHTDPALFIAGQQGMDRVVCRGYHGTKLRSVHTAGDIQNKDGIRGSRSLTNHHAVGCQRGKGNQEVILRCLQPRNVAKDVTDILRQNNRLVRPNAAGMLRRNILRVKGVLPGVQGAAIGLCYQNTVVRHGGAGCTQQSESRDR